MRTLLKFFYLLILSSLLLISSCDESSDDTEIIGNWTKTTPFKGRPRSGAVSFTIGDNVYVGLGYDGDDYLSDFYMYNTTNGFWVARKSFPGTSRERAASFAINGKGYIGVGYNRDLDTEELKDFWSYDPDADDWVQVADFEGSARYNVIAFTIGSKAYVGTGYDGDNYNSDFWSYTPETDTWNEIVSYPGEKLEEGAAFVINNTAYICTGRNNGLTLTAFWSFNPEAGSWTSLKPSDDESYYDEFTNAVRRYDATTFVMNGRGYIATGINSSGSLDNVVYEYNPESGVWTQKTSFEGSARSIATSFVASGRAFLGIGQNGTKRFDDIWEFKPDEEYDEDN